MTSLATLIARPSSSLEEEESSSQFAELSNAIQVLDGLGVLTDVDLLFRSLHSIPPHPALTPSTLRKLYSLARGSLVAPSSSGCDLLDSISSLDLSGKGKGKESTEIISTGFTSLDDLLSGGWHLGEVIELTGVRGSGKTLLVLYSLVLHLLLNPTHHAIYIDTQSSFDAHRCHSIAQVVISSLRERGSFVGIDGEEEIGWEEVSTEALGRISVTKCPTAEVVLNTLGLIPEPTDMKRDTIVVIDSVTTLFSGDFASSSTVAQAQSSMITFMQGMIRLSRTPGSPLTIFLLNNAIPTNSKDSLPAISPFFFQQRLKPDLASALGHLTDMTICLSKAEDIWGPSDRGKIVVEVGRSRRSSNGEWAAFSTDGISMSPILA